jgi:hypothetical protein
VTDHLDRFFADLRTEAMAEVRPPGTAAARRTVRRRRIGASAVAGVVLAVVVAGVAIGARGGDQTEPARPPAPAGELSKWANQVTLAVGVNHQNGPANVLTSTGAGEMHSAHSVIGGTYEVEAACAGEGVVTVSFDVGAAAVATMALRCSSPIEPSVYTLAPVAASMGTIEVRAVPDAAAYGHAAIAYQMTLSDDDRTRLQNTARAALPGDASASTTTSLLTVAAGVRDQGVRPGRYQAWFSCVGTGRVRLSAALVTDESRNLTTPAGQWALTCGPVATVGSVTFTVPETGVDAVDVAVTPDAAATGQAAAAIRISRL